MEQRVTIRVPGVFRNDPWREKEVFIVHEGERLRLLRNEEPGKMVNYYVQKREDGQWWFACGALDPYDIPAVYAEMREYMQADIERRKREKYADLLRRIEQGAKPCFVRFGPPPKCGRSYDYRDQRFEPGVAVYAAFIDREGIIIDLRGTDAVSALFIIGTRDLYIVEGEVVGKTSDGTPAVRATRARRTRKPYKVLL